MSNVTVRVAENIGFVVRCNFGRFDTTMFYHVLQLFLSCILLCIDLGPAAAQLLNRILFALTRARRRLFPAKFAAQSAARPFGFGPGGLLRASLAKTD